ncbi:MAG TPA: DUF2975 domain-containing protein [Caulobacteraceae bacterium]|nr:DUF2975 domain-containing protein [Caulobacteraceae bacterium]
MSTVVQFTPPPAAPEPPAVPGSPPPVPATHRQIQAGSRWLSWLFTALLIGGGAIAAVLIVGILVYPGDDLRIGSDAVWLGSGSADSVAFHTLPLGQRLAYALVGVVRTAPTLLIFWHLRGLFGLYAAGQVFTPGNARHLGRIGVWLCAYAVAPFLCHLFLQATGYEIDRRWMHLSSVQALVLGLLVFVIAQVMQVGHEIEQDREAFV